ncbi:hypothetical protein GH843_30480 [Bacillus thuringiensis]|uniref:Uncharacterized protein n=2 Tax=Bacteria TaxID=2 RepID=A0A643LML7_BACTU|nr:hypothetical protein FPG91_31060 [Bacillus thuringiensis]MBK3313428.1 hypothetical protein [Staphylococcus aureus]MDX7989503.1 hypothetical protein [Xenorhabdus sp. 12]NWK94102.1 hypothetical protein [Sphingobium lactosutens]TNU54314.1 hypothetical protein FH498_19845 [Bacillus velezensis]
MFFENRNSTFLGLILDFWCGILFKNF